MALIKGRSVETNTWHRLEASDDLTAIDPRADLLIALPLWEAHRQVWLSREGRAGVWFAPGDDPERLASDLERLALLAVSFPSFVDGRGYSLARLLRERYGWRGELRAIGDIGRDQLGYLARCGFDAFELRPEEDAAVALRGFRDFSESYQAANDQPLPLFRRRPAGAPA